MLKKLAGIISIIGGVFLYSLPAQTASPLPRLPQSQSIFNHMVTQMSSVESYYFDGSFNLPPTIVSTNPAIKNVLFYGATQLRPRPAAPIKSGVSFFLNEQTLVPTLPTLDIVKNDNKVFLHFSHVDTVASSVAKMFVASSSLAATTTHAVTTDSNNRWLAVPEHKVLAVAGQLTKAVGQSAFNSSTLQELSTTIAHARVPQLSVMQTENLKNLLLENQLVTAESVINTSGDNEDWQQLRLVVHADKVASFLLQLDSSMGGVLISKDQLTEILKNGSSSMYMPAIHVWVGKNDYLLKKLHLSSPASAIDFTMNFGGYNSAVFVPLPTSTSAIIEQEVVERQLQALMY